MIDDCLICAKHRGEGPPRGELVARLGGFWLWHAGADADGLTALGHLVIESDRHVPYLDDLSDDEAASLGRLRATAAHALRLELRPAFVFAAVIGQRVPHFHEHLICRFAGTSDDVPWHASDDAAPRVDAASITDLADRLRARLVP